jgi:hypothetical protein
MSSNRFFEREKFQAFLGIESSTFGVAVSDDNHCTIQAALLLANHLFKQLRDVSEKFFFHSQSSND